MCSGGSLGPTGIGQRRRETVVVDAEYLATLERKLAAYEHQTAVDITSQAVVTVKPDGDL